MKKQYIFAPIAFSIILSNLSLAGANIPAAVPPARHNVNEILGDAGEFKPSTRRGANARIIAAREALVEPAVARLMLLAVARHWTAETPFGAQARELLDLLNPPVQQVAVAPAPAPAIQRVRSTQADLSKLETEETAPLKEVLQPHDGAIDDTQAFELQALDAQTTEQLLEIILQNLANTKLGSSARIELANRFLRGQANFDAINVGIELQLIVNRLGANTAAGAQARLLLIEMRRRGLFETHARVLGEYIADLQQDAGAVAPQAEIQEAQRIVELVTERDRLFEETRLMFENEAARRRQEAEQAMQEEAQATRKRTMREEDEAAINNAAGDEYPFVIEDDYRDFPLADEPVAQPQLPPVPPAPEAPTLNLLHGANVQALVANTVAAIAAVTPVAVKAARVVTKRRR